jgi:putative spermidine/putrescine transport system permease protein
MKTKNKSRGALAPLFKNLSVIGLLPFILFTLGFIIFPAGSLLIGGFQDKLGNFTFHNIYNLTRPDIIHSYLLTIEISLVTALGGGLFGFLLAYGITLGALPHFVQGFINTFCGVASNFAGVPLAFAFISTLGRVGMITVLLQSLFGINIYDRGFNLYSFWGLSITYMYFQIPLMVLIVTPALEGMKKQWREAAENLGATSFQYWRTVALPILAPTLLASFILLFGNAFGAYATAYALTGGLLNIIPILIGAQIRGDVLHDPNLGYALALGMVFLMTVLIFVYTWLQKIYSRWIQ